jgi:P-type Mg2+ transporter
VLNIETAATLDAAEVLKRLGTPSGGLSSGEAERRLSEYGKNEIADRHASPLAVFGRQLTNPFLILLVSTAVLSIALHDSSDALIILCIVVLSVGLSFVNEYRSERAVEDLRARVQRKTLVRRDGKQIDVVVAALVPGDIVTLDVGDIVPADLRLIDVRALECDESPLTGESMPQSKSIVPCVPGGSDVTQSCCVYSGTVVKNGTATGVVVATAAAARVGSIARELSRHAPHTAFEVGLRAFSLLLVRVTVALASVIFVVNALLHHPWLESLLFALAIAIGLTPQLLPAIVTLSLSFGARLLAKRGVIVKRLVSIEDLGNVEVLFTDKTGTLTEGRVRFRGAVDAVGANGDAGVTMGLVCSDVVNENGNVLRGNALDVALWQGAKPECVAAASAYRVVDRMPFSYDRQMASVLVDAPDGRRLLICKGAPEALLSRCTNANDTLRETLDREFENGIRAIAVASREAPGLAGIGENDERELVASALLLFADEPKADARASLERLAALKITLKIVTGDNPKVAASICRQLGLEVSGVLTGTQLAAMNDAQLIAALPVTSIFARVTPEQKSRIIRLARLAGSDVGFLGDGVNDAVALHDADVGISVDSAVDVAKDAADIVLVEKDLDVLADGVMEGRRIFANTIKYVLMGTSSNFGNMFSAAGASLFLQFLPMLPSQILLNNLLYDVSEMAIPTDNVDADQLQRPARWDQRFIRRFMMFFGPISSIFDFATFGVMLFIFHAGAALFRTGWFVESLSTQSLVIFLIRTRRVPFFRSRASATLTATTVAVVIAGAALPFTPMGAFLGFVALPKAFFAILGLMIVLYLALIELGKLWFFRSRDSAAMQPSRASTERSSPDTPRPA